MNRGKRSTGKNSPNSPDSLFTAPRDKSPKLQSRLGHDPKKPLLIQQNDQAEWVKLTRFHNTDKAMSDVKGANTKNQLSMVQRHILACPGQVSITYPYTNINQGVIT